MTSLMAMRRRAMGKSGPLVSDPFDRADSTLNGSTADTGQVWTAAAVFVVANNQLAAIDGQVLPHDLAHIDAGTGNQEVTATLAVLPGANWVGMTARYSDANNFYFVDVNPNGAGRVYKYVAGVFTELAVMANGTFAAGDKLACRANGSSIAALRNGAVVASVTDTSLAVGNRAGVRLNLGGAGWRLDDFKVTAA